MYIAIGRATNIDNLFFMKNNPNVFKVIENAIIEYKTLQENRLGRIYTDHDDYNSLTVS